MLSRAMLLVLLGCLAVLQVSPARTAAPAPLAAAGAAAPAQNLALELRSLVRAVPRKEIKNLVQSYLLNDAEFQSVIRAINTLPAYRLRMQLLNQPEVRQLRVWLAQQLLLSGGSKEIFDDLEFTLFNKYPFWAQTVSGVQGFQLEFAAIYPAQALRSLLESQAQQSPLFAELWRRLVGLKVAYERVLATQQARLVISQLRGLGVNIEGVDSLIRYQLGWSNATWPGNNWSVGNDYNDYFGLN